MHCCLQHWGRGRGGSEESMRCCFNIGVGGRGFEEYIKHVSGHSCFVFAFRSHVHVPCRLQIIQVNIGEGGSTKRVAHRCFGIDLRQDDLFRFHCLFKRWPGDRLYYNHKSSRSQWQSLYKRVSLQVLPSKAEKSKDTTSIGYACHIQIQKRWLG